MRDSDAVYGLRSVVFPYLQIGLPVLANVGSGNDLAELVQKEGVVRVCTDHSVNTLQRLA